MPLNPTYSVGTVSVSAGSAIVNGDGTLFVAGGLRAGDVFERDGLSVTLAETPTSNTQLTLVKPWPGVTGSGSYEVRYTADAARVIGAARDIVARTETLPMEVEEATLVAARARDASGVVPQQFGTVTAGWQTIINQAIIALSNSGGGKLALPAIPGGYTITSDVVLRNGVELAFMPGAFIKVADGAHNVRPISTVNFDAHAGAAVSRADASRGWKITNGWVDGNRANTTWDEGQFSGIGAALYGIDFEIDGLKIFNTHGTGLCTFYDGGPSPRDGRNGIASDIYVQTAGRHGWHNRLTDFHVDNVNIVMPSRNGDNLWDGALLERSVRMSNINIWTTISAAGGIFPRTALNVQTGGATIKNAHLETGHLLLDVNGQYNQIEAYLYYGVGEAHAQLRNNFNQLDLCMTNTFYEVYEGLRIGTATGQAQYNQVRITGSAFRNAIVNFINSAGFNSINGRCFAPDAGALMIGDPHPFDAVDLAGSYAGVFKQYSKKAGTTNALVAAGTDQATAALVERDQVRVTGANGTAGVRLTRAVDGREAVIYNSANAVLRVYPATGQRFSGLSANAPLDIPAFATRRLTVIDAGVWLAS